SAAARLRQARESSFLAGLREGRIHQFRDGRERSPLLERTQPPVLRTGVEMTLRSDNAYLVLGCKPWNRRVYNEMLAGLPGNWQFIGSREEFALDLVRKIAPRYIFFLHWSWQVPSEIVDDYECVCFHMTDVPYGRGGSPLQNLILRGHRETKLTALRMTGEIDAGPVYFKESLSLEGNAEEIYLRATRLSATLVKRFMNVRTKHSTTDGEV